MRKPGFPADGTRHILGLAIAFSEPEAEAFEAKSFDVPRSLMSGSRAIVAEQGGDLAIAARDMNEQAICAAARLTR
ncbi:hypothetical protein [Rhizobium mesoamericanum]|uniref:hypothetical protein n=1 Tax=Rhizobium mesoamericanum TaxID=1079800 RepID=UPI0004043569|nr:hypothetical protein [Rhizobium mesoamericanum]